MELSRECKIQRFEVSVKCDIEIKVLVVDRRIREKESDRFCIGQVPIVRSKQPSVVSVPPCSTATAALFATHAHKPAASQNWMLAPQCSQPDHKVEQFSIDMF